MGEFNHLPAQLSGFEQLSDFDAHAVATVEALLARLVEARRLIADEGAVATSPTGIPLEHPAVKVERMASAEIRGWIKDRPDLFGAKRSAGKPSKQGEKFGGFKVVN